MILNIEGADFRQVLLKTLAFILPGIMIKDK
jgi:hypothetical protein